MRRALLGLVGLAILAVILVRIDLSTVLSELKNSELTYLALAVFLIIVVALLKAWRWRLLLRMLGVNYSTKQAIMVYFSGLFLGIATPGRIGEFSKALYVSKDTEAKLRTGLVSTLTDRLFDLYALITVGGIGLALILDEMAVLIALPVLLLLPILFLRSNMLVRLLERKSTRLYEVYIEARKLRFTVPILITVIVYAVFFLHAWCLVLALDLPISLPVIIGFVAIVSLVEIVPITLAGLGTRDATLIALFATQGLSAESAVSYSLLMLLTGHLVIAVLGGIAWQLKPLRL